MKRIITILAFLLVAGCAKKDEENERDWIIGKWDLISCTYVNERTGEKGTIMNAGFKSWEFTEDGTVIIDRYIVQDYWHKNGQICVQSIVYDEVAHDSHMMQIEQSGFSGVTTYTFTR